MFFTHFMYFLVIFFGAERRPFLRTFFTLFRREAADVNFTHFFNAFRAKREKQITHFLFFYSLSPNLKKKHCIGGWEFLEKPLHGS